jgi:hypothetical protein
LLCRCGGSECYVNIGVLEQIGDSYYFWTMIGESCPYLVFFNIRVLVSFLLYPLVEFLEHLLWYVVVFAIVCIVFYSFCFLFG